MESNSKFNFEKFSDDKFSILNEIKDKKICIFCAGKQGKFVASDLMEKDVEILAFCDNDESKTDGSFAYKGIPCIPFEELLKIKDDVVVLVATALYEEIFEQLKKHNFKTIYNAQEFRIRFCDFFENNSIEKFQDEINKAYSYLSDEKSKEVFSFCLNIWASNVFSYKEIKTDHQYFEKGIVNIKHDEVFVDVGAFDGDSFEEFILNAPNGFEKYIAFELNPNNAKVFREKLLKFDEKIAEKVTIIEKGVSNVNAEIFLGNDTNSSKISDDNMDNSIKGEIVRIDDVLDEKITFLKMDIEGAELDALEGSKELIKKYKPTLAICVYHHPSHIWEVPNYIKSLVPGYKIYIRHYTDTDNETVCYAIHE